MGTCLRILVEIELHLPLHRGQILNVKWEKVWMLITYKKLPKLCFRCGQILHGLVSCTESGQKLHENKDQFGPWMRANMHKKLSLVPLPNSGRGYRQSVSSSSAKFQIEGR